jgi:hypothetical protein
MGQGNGVSIGISVSTQRAAQELNKLGQQFGKFGSATKGLFGGQTQQQAASYVKHLQQLERQLERTTQRVKSLQAAQQALLNQQKALTAAGAPSGAPQVQTISRALQQNQRSLSYWQARQAGAQAAQAAQSGQGGGGMPLAMLGSLAGRYWLPGMVASAAVGAVTSGMGVADREQKLLADILPRQRLGGLAGTNTKALMDRLRGVSRPLGYSGAEALGFAGDMTTAGGTFGHGLERDTQAAMQAARLMGLDAGGLAAAGRMGGFQPGNARRFANMLAQELKITGMGGRAAEVQEATLSLLSRQMTATGTANPAVALGLQTILAKTGVPGLKGMAGAGVLAQMDEAVKGANDEPSVAFIQSALRDQLGVRGYFDALRMQEGGVLGDKRMLPALIRQAFQTNPNGDSAKLLLSRVLHVPVTVLDKMPLSKITPENASHYARLLDKGTLGAGATASMGLTGNQLRLGDAARADALAKIGGPIVKGLADISTHAVHAYDKLSSIAASSKTTAEKITDAMGYVLGPAFVGPLDPRRTNPTVGGYSISPNGKVTPYTPWGMPILPQRAPRHNSVPILPPNLAPANPMTPGSGLQVVPRHNSTNQRSSVDINHHLIDHTGGLHPHAKQRLLATLREALSELHLTNALSQPNQRYPRA